MSKRTTINDLSKALHLSPTLISMVLNGKGDQNKISKATQKRVLLMAKKMGYTPNQSARALRTGRTNVIGLIIPDISNAFYSGLVKRFEELLQQQNYRIIVGSTDEDAEKEMRLIRLFTDQNVDGIIAASTLSSPEPYEEFAQQGKSVVFFDRTFSTTSLPSVSVENRKGATMAMEQLMASGKKDIGFLTLSPAHISPLKDRLEGFLDAIKTHHLNNGTRIHEIKFEELENGFGASIDDFLSQYKGIDAILVANNNLAFRLMKYIRDSSDAHLKKISIISFDDHLAFELASPSVTSIAQPMDEMAKQVVVLMLNQLNKQVPEKPNVVLPVTLVARESHLVG